MKRILIFSALLILSLLVVACSGDKNPATTAKATTAASQTTLASQTTAATTTAAVTTESTVLVIASSESCDYKVIVASDAPETVIDAADLLNRACFLATGKRLSVNKDSTEESTKEIVIGITNRNQPAEDSEELAKNAYTITVSDDKIFVVGGSRSALIAGVNKLYKDYFENKEGNIEVPKNLSVAETIPMEEIFDLESGWTALSFKASNGVNLPYQIYIPLGYDFNKEYPCILYMHSAGVVCTDNSHIYQGEAEFLRLLERNRYKKETIVIAPCCPPGSKWIPASTWNQVTYDYTNTDPTPYMKATLELLNYYTSEINIDTSRLYTYGMSMGGFAVWDLLARNPGMFAAAVPVAGAGDPTTVKNMGDTAIWIFHGTLDDVVPVESSYAMIDALKEARGEDGFKFTEFPTLYHGIWGATANTEGLFDWMFSQSLDD